MQNRDLAQVAQHIRVKSNRQSLGNEPDAPDLHCYSESERRAAQHMCLGAVSLLPRPVQCR